LRWRRKVDDQDRNPGRVATIKLAHPDKKNAHCAMYAAIEDSMDPEKIKVRVTETGQTLDVVVYSKRADRIEIVLGEGIHNVKCDLTRPAWACPTPEA